MPWRRDAGGMAAWYLSRSCAAGERNETARCGGAAQRSAGESAALLVARHESVVSNSLVRSVRRSSSQLAGILVGAFFLS